MNRALDLDSGFGDVVEERDGSGNLTARYDYGDDLINMQRSTGTSWYLFDGHGSTRDLSDNSGNVTDTYSYDAFGNLLTQTGSTVNSYLYDAQEQDATGLYYLRARYMDPTRGEFASQDPFGGDDETPATLHRYLYAFDDPTDEADQGGAAAYDVGNEVHRKIGLDFVTGSSSRLSDKTFYQIYGAAYPGYAGRTGYLPYPWNRRRPDLVDFSPSSYSSSYSSDQKAFYEIKPVTSYLDGINKIISYGYGLNAYDPTLGGTYPSPPVWVPGDFQVYTPKFLMPLSNGDVAIVLPPSFGVILYQVIDPNTVTAALEISLFAQFAISQISLAGAGVAAGEVASTTGAGIISDINFIGQLQELGQAAESIATTEQIPALVNIGEAADPEEAALAGL